MPEAARTRHQRVRRDAMAQRIFRQNAIVGRPQPKAEMVALLESARQQQRAIDLDVQSTARQVPVWAELDNPADRPLLPGLTATMVIYDK